MTSTGIHTCVFFDDADELEAACPCGTRALRLLADDGTEYLVRLETGERPAGVTVGSFGERPRNLAASA